MESDGKNSLDLFRCDRCGGEVWRMHMPQHLCPDATFTDIEAYQKPADVIQPKPDLVLEIRDKLNETILVLQQWQETLSK